jgi:hypothetical protein
VGIVCPRRPSESTRRVRASPVRVPRSSDTVRGFRELELTAFVDTNVLIRHLTGDPPEMATRATAVLASGERLLLADLVLAEGGGAAEQELTPIRACLTRHARR